MMRARRTCPTDDRHRREQACRDRRCSEDAGALLLRGLQVEHRSSHQRQSGHRAGLLTPLSLASVPAGGSMQLSGAARSPGRSASAEAESATPAPAAGHGAPHQQGPQARGHRRFGRCQRWRLVRGRCGERRGSHIQCRAHRDEWPGSEIPMPPLAERRGGLRRLRQLWRQQGWPRAHPSARGEAPRWPRPEPKATAGPGAAGQRSWGLACTRLLAPHLTARNRARRTSTGEHRRHRQGRRCRLGSRPLRGRLLRQDRPLDEGRVRRLRW